MAKLTDVKEAATQANSEMEANTEKLKQSQAEVQRLESRLEQLTERDTHQEEVKKILKRVTDLEGTVLPLCNGQPIQ